MAKVSYQHTLGCEPWLLGHVTEHGPVLSMAYLITGGIATLNLGWPFALLAIAAWWNDYRAVTQKVEPRELKLLWADDEEGDAEPKKLEPQTIESKAEVLEPEAVTVKSEAVEPKRAEYDSKIYSEPNPFTASEGRYQPDPTYRPKPMSDWERDMEAQIEQQVKARTEQFGKEAVGVASQLMELEDGKLRSWFITGVSGTGKGVLTTFSMLYGKRHIPGLSLWGIDAKADPTEYSRWAIIPENQRLHFDAMDPNLNRATVKRIEEGIKDLLDRFYRDSSPHKVLWIDEFPAIASTVSPAYAKLLINFVFRLASMGRSRGCAVWLGTNAVGLRQNKMDKSGRDFFHEIYLATPRNLHKIVEHSSFPGKTSPSAQLINMTGRVAWVSTMGDWVAIPKTYDQAVKDLPNVQPPNDLGKAMFGGHEGKIAARELADQLIDNLGQHHKAPLATLVEGTCMEGMDLETVEQKVIPVLRGQETIIRLEQIKNVWYACKPQDLVADLMGAFQ